jgi:hypothetical protein
VLPHPAAAAAMPEWCPEPRTDLPGNALWGGCVVVVVVSCSSAQAVNDGAPSATGTLLHRHREILANFQGEFRRTRQKIVRSRCAPPLPPAFYPWRCAPPQLLHRTAQDSYSLHGVCAGTAARIVGLAGVCPARHHVRSEPPHLPPAPCVWCAVSVGVRARVWWCTPPARNSRVVR